MASVVVNGTPAQVALGCLLVLVTGAACGLLNGVISVYGGVQPIIATLATGAMYTGFAYLIRPIPGGSIDEALAEALTYETFGVIPTSLLVLAAAVVLIWLPFRNSMLGRGCYAVGSSTTSAYMSGVAVNRCKLAAFVLAGVFASLGGLFLSLQTLSGDAQLGGRLHPEVDRRGGDRGHVAAGWQRRHHRLDHRRLRAAHHQRRPPVRGRLAAGAAAVRGARPAGRDQRRRDLRPAHQEPA